MLIEYVDERGRTTRYEPVLSSVLRVVQTHGYSYLHARELYQEMGEVMGLDREEGLRNVRLLQSVEVLSSSPKKTLGTIDDEVD